MTDGPATTDDNDRRAAETERPPSKRPTVTLERWVEVHRLAVAGREAVIARHAGTRIARIWLPRSRFADAAALARATLTLGPDADAFYHLGWTQAATGQPRPALDSNESALRLYREAGDRAGEATTLNNIGAIRFQQGDLAGAKDAFDRVLEIVRVVSDRRSEAMSSFNMAVLLSRMARVDDAIEFQCRAIALAEQTEHPALDQMRTFLVQLRQMEERTGDGDGDS